MSEFFDRPSMGWLPDYPDFRDYTARTKTIVPLMRKVKGADAEAKKGKRPAACDLRSWCSPVEDQGKIGSCTAHAGVGMVEYFERRATGKHVDASRLFLYKVTRNLLHWTGDTGAFLRTAMGALVLFGVPPEEARSLSNRIPYFAEPDYLRRDKPAAGHLEVWKMAPWAVSAARNSRSFTRSGRMHLSATIFSNPAWPTALAR